jgi:apolipoprotein N-acyltransferase
MELNLLNNEKIKKVTQLLELDLDELKGRIIFFLLFSFIAAMFCWIGDSTWPIGLKGLSTVMWTLGGVAAFSAFFVPIVAYLDQ